ncbi:MAG: N5,N10-methylenetetrahydromethanopterin reductase-related protein [Ktedonobacterales bacterium]|jgi:F420-dependent oxidoreductase-like protein|nr:MAG: N5,N10-methylenetetrahydromethanopterin reductase-related protein [Ktedonobacterales bacterium]
MRLGLSLGYWGARPADALPLVQEAEQLGFDSIWTSEAYGSDGVTPLAWLGALTSRIKLGTDILQIPARTPAMTAMTAATLDLLSNGRVLLGLGVSGPQVVEGWHGRPYGKPLVRTREYVEILRRIWERKDALTYDGEEYQIPYQGGTGLGKPLKITLHPLRSRIPIYLAAIGPKNVEMAGEIADGWLPIFYAPEREKLFLGPLDVGLAKRTAEEPFDIAPTVTVVLGDDVQMCREMVKPMLALYIGGMGARGKNFYNDLACRYGYEAAAKEIQDLYLDGKKKGAAAAVPDELVDAVALCGPKERIAERLEIWKQSRATTLICGTIQPEALRVMAELAL